MVLLLFSQTNQDTTIDKSKLLGVDYRLFQDTPAWDLTKAVKDEDTLKIKAAVNENKSLLTFREPRFGQSILQLAVENANYNSVKALLELGADPNLQDLYRGDSPLMEAANIWIPEKRTDTRFLKLLLKYGGDPNAKENGPEKAEYTPLRFACENNNLDNVKILVEAGANVNTIDAYGGVVLQWALITADLYQNPDIIIYLIKKGVDYKRALGTTVPEGKNIYITDYLRDWFFDLGSEAYKKKMWIVAFLKKNGMDYWTTPIPERYLEHYPKEYLEKY